MTQQFRVGVVAGTHGIKGDIRIFPTTDEPARFKKLKYVYIDSVRGQIVRTAISNVRLQDKFVLAHLEGYNTPEEARLIRNQDLLIDREDALPLREGEYYVPDLIGMRVVTDEGEEIGVLKDVLETGANDVYSVETPEGQEILIPKIPQCILEVDVEGQLMKVHLLPGLR